VDRHSAPRSFRPRRSARLRPDLLEVRGRRPEITDAALRYAGRKLRDHGLHKGRDRYETLRRTFENALARDAARYNEFHALIARAGSRFCRARIPRRGGERALQALLQIREQEPTVPIL
jgi:endonuclease III-like uncharacterized protein